MKLRTIAAASDGVERVAFDCHGCGEMHVIPVTGPHAWKYNRDPECPTFTPSILVSSQRWTGEAYAARCCHSFVSGGRIQFLGDCTHALSGQTVELPEIVE